MSTKNYQNIKTYLEHELGRLVRERATFAGATIDETFNHGLLDKRDEVVSQRLEQEIKLLKMKHVEKQMAEVERALKKIEAGSYGLCDICGLPIPAGRLEALPQTSHCLECKRKQTVNL
jgi:RNA polymerase-binding protein DksA